MSWEKSYQPKGPAKFSQNGWVSMSTVTPPKPRNNVIFYVFWAVVIINAVGILALKLGVI